MVSLPPSTESEELGHTEDLDQVLGGLAEIGSIDALFIYLDVGKGLSDQSLYA